MHRGPQECLRACVCARLAQPLAEEWETHVLSLKVLFVAQWAPVLTRAPSFRFYVSFLSVLAGKSHFQGCPVLLGDSRRLHLKPY